MSIQRNETQIPDLRVDTYLLALALPQNGHVKQQIQLNQIDANGINFSYLECGSGPIALCVHEFPDSAHTWRFLMPALAKAGFRAIAPFTRGYAPTSLAPCAEFVAYGFGGAR
jgi:hypothetical protein